MRCVCTIYSFLALHAGLQQSSAVILTIVRHYQRVASFSDRIANRNLAYSGTSSLTEYAAIDLATDTPPPRLYNEMTPGMCGHNLTRLPMACVVPRIKLPQQDEGFISTRQILLKE